MKYTFTLENDAILIIAKSLHEQPFRVAQPILAELEAQINAQNEAMNQAAPTNPTPEGQEMNPKSTSH